MRDIILAFTLFAVLGCLGLLIEMRTSMQKIMEIEGPRNHYFATTEDGRLIPMTSLDERNMSKEALMSWASQAVSETMSFGFSDYRRRFEAASGNFTKNGWGDFTRFLNESGILDSIRGNRQVVSAIPSGAPVLLNEGEENGHYFWQIELPIVFTYEAGSKRRTDNLIIKLKIVRTPRLENKNGIAINQWSASDA